MPEPQQIKDRLQAASERRAAIRGEMVRGEISVDDYRQQDAAELAWIDTLLGRLAESLRVHA